MAKSTGNKSSDLVTVKSWFTQKNFIIAVFIIFSILFSIASVVWLVQTHSDSSLNGDIPESAINKLFYVIREVLYKIIVLYFLSKVVNKK
jgi:hypothetical protein